MKQMPFEFRRAWKTETATASVNSRWRKLTKASRLLMSRQNKTRSKLNLTEQIKSNTHECWHFITAQEDFTICITKRLCFQFNTRYRVNTEYCSCSFPQLLHLDYSLHYLLLKLIYKSTKKVIKLLNVIFIKSQNEYPYCTSFKTQVFCVFFFYLIYFE